MSNYRTMQYATSNEDGMEEIVIERNSTISEFFRLLLANRSWSASQVVTETWVLERIKSGNGEISRWVDKYSDELAYGDVQLELFRIKGEMQAQNRSLK